MISSNALVQPRAISPLSNENMPLLDLVLDQVGTDVRKIRLVGRGIKTALAYLTDELSMNPEIQVLGVDEEVAEGTKANLTVFANFNKAKCRADLELKLARWGQDEVIEYLMAKSVQNCKSVMTRLTKSADLWLANGSPRVIAKVLDLMIDSEEIRSVEEAILALFESLDITEKQKKKLLYLCVEHLFSSEDAGIAFYNLTPQVINIDAAKFLTNQTVRYVLATETILTALRKQKKPKIMMRNWPQTFVDLIGKRIQNDVPINNFLNTLSNEIRTRFASNAASLLVHNDKNWRPTAKERQCFEQGKFSGVNWAETSLEFASLSNADLSFANMRKCNLQQATLTSTNFFKACLAAASLTGAYARRSDFSNASMRAITGIGADFYKSNFEKANLECSDISSANFNGANLKNANLSNCYLWKARFSDADLSNCDLSKSRLIGAMLRSLDLRSTNLDECDLTGASLKRCDLEGKSLDLVTMKATLFNGAILTGTKFRNCTMTDCILTNAKMADIDWEDCDLSGANFFNCQFLMGSTRAGTVDSPYPSHGTRTGFYTDDYDDHYFKTPEETRKANLCGCNLTGAKVLEADFYLVDLRGAIYDEQQKAHFQKCGAILHD